MSARGAVSGVIPQNPFFSQIVIQSSGPIWRSPGGQHETPVIARGVLRDRAPYRPCRIPSRAKSRIHKGQLHQIRALRPHARRRPSLHRRVRSEEHTSELQSPCNLVCRLLLEKKKKKTDKAHYVYSYHSEQQTLVTKTS